MEVIGLTTESVDVDGGEQSSGPDRPAHNVRLPGFISDQEVGLGDVIKRVTRRAGIQPCGGCEGRAATLNRWLTFSPRNSD